MNYVPLGNTGLKVSRICLGTMNYGWRMDEEASIRMTHAAIDAGINFIDTANVYGGRERLSEKWLGKALRGGKRDGVVLATKFWAGGPGPNDRGGSRYNIMKSVEQSLQRLQTDRIDLYIMHRAERDETGAPIEETLSALTDLVRQGKVRYIGTSNFAAWRLVEAQLTSRLGGFETFCSDQLNYSILDRFVEMEILRVCRKYRIGVTVWGPLHNGWLSGKYRQGKAPPPGTRGADKLRVDLDSVEGKQTVELIEKLVPLAEERGISLPQFALAWLLKNEAVTSVICGPRLPEHLEESIAVDEIDLDDAAMKAVDEICPPPETHGEWW